MNTDDVNRKIVLITGGTDGIGREAAVELARRGATVLVTGRDRTKGEASIEAIRRESEGGTVELFLADFASQAAVRALANEITDRYDRLDVLVNNAGVWPTDRVVTADGVERTFAVNYLAPFLLTDLLLPLLQAAPAGRVVNVSSSLHAGGSLDFDDLHGEHSFAPRAAYCQSKFALVVYTYELARRLDGSGVTVNALEPGFVPGTSLYRSLPWYVRWLGPVLDRLPVIRSPRTAATTYVSLAASPDFDGVTGQYFTDKGPTQSAPGTYDHEIARQLWSVSTALVEQSTTNAPQIPT